jgi:uncharacterized protein YggE
MDNPTDTTPTSTKPPKPLRWILAGLTVALVLSLVATTVLAVSLANGGKGATRTVTVTGDATLKATPDEYVFYPSYNFTNPDKDAALKELTAKSDEVVAGLKKVGVADSAIKTNSNGYDTPVYLDSGPIRKENATYNLQITVTVDNKELSQKVQDYLVSTSPSGGVSPQADFSDKKRKQLESQARDEATKDARSKADQQAKNLGFKVGKVQSVDDGSGFGGVRPFMGRNSAEPAIAEDSATSTQLSVQPGENELNYSVTVVYTIR